MWIAGPMLIAAILGASAAAAAAGAVLASRLIGLNVSKAGKARHAPKPRRKFRRLRLMRRSAAAF